MIRVCMLVAMILGAYVCATWDERDRVDAVI